MIFQFLAELNHGFLLTSLSLLTLFGISYTWIIVIQYLRYRRTSLAEEARILATPLPTDELLPHVLVQIPTFNERDLVCRVAESIGRFDWPKDRLHIQILDDSTDGSLSFAEQAVSSLRQQNIDAELLHRKNRYGFKAGALAEGLRRSNHEYVAIFDVDYIPSSDFLRLAIRPLLRDPLLALVQVRCDFINANDNFLTRVQQRIIDAHYSVEQPARSWSGHIMPFNGTCGIIRRAAIDEAGGWLGDTLAEDLDLSYRIQLLGWRSLFLFTVTVPGELPTTFKAWQTQQFRWTKGFNEVTRKLLPKIWQSHIALRHKLIAVVHLFCGIFGSLLGIAVITTLIDSTVGIGSTPLSVALSFITAIVWISGLLVMFLLGQKVARNANLFREVLKMPLVLVLFFYIALVNSHGAMQSYLRRNTAFVRTPKKRIKADDHDSGVKDLP
jgi:cellulose synthase/poly-beta-1,6-N-acetylglucosamine synthase-like glycosyltransferase